LVFKFLAFVVTDDGYSRNVSCALNLISLRFYYRIAMAYGLRKTTWHFEHII